MPPGLIKSPNTGDLYKFNLYDELYSDPTHIEYLRKLALADHQILNNFNKENLRKKRLLSSRMLINKKNNPEIKFSILNHFIDKIK
jgi:hypothetical protein